MNAALEGVFILTARALLRAYPPAFRARFGGEMLQVYRALARQAGEDAGARGLLLLWLRAVVDGMIGALAQWEQQITKRRMAMMNLNPVDANDGSAPLPAGQALLAVLPFLLFGAANIAQQVTPFKFWTGNAPLALMLVTHPYLVFHWFILLGLGAGILCGFPRWAFPYGFWALLDTFWWANASFYGQPVNWMVLPLAAVVIGALLIRRRMHPASLVLPAPWRDLTLLPLVVYTFFTSVYMLYDENHHPALLVFMGASGLAAALGAWGFFRSASPLRRALALAGGLALAVALEITNSLTWDAGAYYGFADYSPVNGIVSGIVFFAVVTAGMLGTGWLAEWMRRRKKPV